ncbi:hypothetical protein NHX12_003889 [Muraenolepis orangiensis]|uniref:Uncharacterized protein n=1 Tax=Muraenolepis orangiensis TaxID=630683 RepID=A0A9Q0IBP2_9TELE|nr:hypothetical protein NHX12_003889 [Muraenolepis orangiensis]
MIIEASRWSLVADIFFSLKTQDNQKTHCLCSRAFVQDRELYCSDNSHLSSNKDNSDLQGMSPHTYIRQNRVPGLHGIKFKVY